MSDSKFTFRCPCCWTMQAVQFSVVPCQNDGVLLAVMGACGHGTTYLATPDDYEGRTVAQVAARKNTTALKQQGILTWS